MRLVRPLLAVLLTAVTLIPFSGAAHDSRRWRLLWEERGLRMYSAENTPLPTFKAQGVLHAHLVDLLAVVADVPRRPHWVPHLVKSRILSGDIQSRVVIHEQFDLPWPIADRECVVESVIHRDYERGEVTVTYHEVRHPAARAQGDWVRLPVVRGSMTFRYIDESHTFVNYEATIDIGGILPEWAVARALRDGPLLTLHGVLTQAKKSRERYSGFIREQRAKLKFAPRMPPPGQK